MADLIIPWSEVRAGDVALYQGGLVTVLSLGPETPSPQVVQFNVLLADGRPLLIALFRDNLTAVRRLVETSAPREGTP